VDLDRRRLDRAQAIGQRAAGMQEAGRIEQDAIDAGSVGRVDRRHRLAFVAGVENIQCDSEPARLPA